jgi:hypothetical protein
MPLQAGVDYIAFGAAYPSLTKPQAPPMLRSTCFFGQKREIDRSRHLRHRRHHR